MTSPTPPEAELDKILSDPSDRWRHCAGHPESTLLKLVILREVVRLLHAQKSKCLAEGRRELAQSLRAWESRLLELRSHPKLDGELRDLLSGTAAIRKRSRLLPESLYTHLEREKLDRYDRQWESAIAAEACSLGWRFWKLEAWVEITLAEEWNQRLTEQLWPSGIVLFVESGESGESSSSRATPDSSTLWKGRWYSVVHPRFKTPAELTAHLAHWAGSPSQAPEAARWSLVFSPR